MFSTLHIRADAHNLIGYGHVMRTMSLAKEIDLFFPVNILYYQLFNTDINFVRKKYSVIKLKNNSTQELSKHINNLSGPLILDSYLITEDYLKELKKNNFFIVVFDDGCRLKYYDADIVIDSAPLADNLNYRGNKNTIFCLGTSYFPLREEFKNKLNIGTDKNSTKKILITFGGSDPDDITYTVLNNLLKYSLNLNYEIVLGAGYKGILKNWNNRQNVNFHFNITYLSDLMQQADIILCGAGGTALEAAAIGCSSIIIELSDNQKNIAKYLELAGAGINLGKYKTLDYNVLIKQIENLIQSKKTKMSEVGKKLIDGKGCKRITMKLINEWNKFKKKY